MKSASVVSFLKPRSGDTFMKDLSSFELFCYGSVPDVCHSPSSHLAAVGIRTWRP